MSEVMITVICGNPRDPVSVYATAVVNRVLSDRPPPTDAELDALWRAAESPAPSPATPVSVLSEAGKG